MRVSFQLLLLHWSPHCQQSGNQCQLPSSPPDMIPRPARHGGTLTVICFSTSFGSSFSFSASSSTRTLMAPSPHLQWRCPLGLSQSQLLPIPPGCQGLWSQAYPPILEYRMVPPPWSPDCLQPTLILPLLPSPLPTLRNLKLTF